MVLILMIIEFILMYFLLFREERKAYDKRKIKRDRLKADLSLKGGREKWSNGEVDKLGEK